MLGDVKPANLLLHGQNGEWRVLIADLGAPADGANAPRHALRGRSPAPPAMSLPLPPAYTKPARREWTALGPLRVRHRPQQTHGQGDRSAPASAWRTGGWAMRRGPVPAGPHGVVPMRRRGHGKLFISGGS